MLNGLLATGKIRLTDLGASARLDAEAALTRSLFKRNVITKEDLRAALSQQMTELVCDAFLWSDAAFEFQEGDPADEYFDVDQLDHEIRLTCEPMIMEALRRIDEWPEVKKTISSALEILVQEPNRNAANLDPITARVLGCLDGQRRLKDVIELTHLGTFNVFKAAAALKAGGFVRTLAPKEAFDRARAFASKGQWEPCLTMARVALEIEPHQPALRSLAAEALEKLDRRDEAAAEYRQLCAAQVEAGDRDGAIATCRKILAIAPRDTFTQERLFQFLLDAGQRELAIQQGESLAAACKRAGLPDKAIDVYSRLMAALGDSDDLLEATAEVARHLGDKKEAIQIYRKLFDRALARGDEATALTLSRTLLRLDPSLEDIAKHRVELETGVYRKRVAMRRRIRFVLLGIGLLALFAVALVYELRARDLHGSIRADSIGLAAKSDYRAILVRYDGLLDRFSWALTCLDAQRERGAIEDLHADAMLALATSLETELRLAEAITAAESARDLSRTDRNRRRSEERLVGLRHHRNEEENKWLEVALGWARAARADSSLLAKIADIRHPLALPALGECLKEDSPLVRKATIAALRNVPDDAALELLVRALATDTDPSLRDEASAALTSRTGQKFETALQWDEWLRKRAVAASPTRVPPLQAALLAPSARAEIGKPLVVRWEIVNVGPSSVEFSLPADFGPVFEGTGPGGVITMKSPPARGEDRVIRLRPGELLGGTADLTALCRGLDAPGSARIAWSGTVRWNGGAPAPVKSLPVVIDLVR
jgi:hypothetical protein